MKLGLPVYGDGFGRAIQHKELAAPGPVGSDGTIADPRWVGSGWVILNNKGKPVRHYEPFFRSGDFAFEFAAVVGVSPIAIYDPTGRLLANLQPNHALEKTRFDPWRQTSWDAADTVMITDPREDADIGSYIRRLPEADYLPGWYEQRASGARWAQAERDAAEKQLPSPTTPSTAYLDGLGRVILTVADNGPGGRYATRKDLDIVGNLRVLKDPMGRDVVEMQYDTLGRILVQHSMEGGTRWTLSDCAGKPIRTWDGMGRAFRVEYDALPPRRISNFVRHASEFWKEGRGDAEILYERTEYGEGIANAVELNVRTRIYRAFDSAGVTVNEGRNPRTGRQEAYDFKGNLLHSRREIASDFRIAPDWSGPVELEPEVFTSSQRYDALNRSIEMTGPDGSVVLAAFNRSSLLERVEVDLPGEEGRRRPVVTASEYDAKGQRIRIVYGNEAETTYRFDPLTLRLIGLSTHRPADGHEAGHVQDLHYTYDSVGNITHIHDTAQPITFFRNRQVEPSNDYAYDAIYRLVEVRGREHLGQHRPTPPSYDDASKIGLSFACGDAQAMGRYRERYRYDAADNLLEVIHRGADPAVPGWTRHYAYDEPSQIEPRQRSNRLTSTRIGDITQRYSEDGDGYDAHGHMLRMPQLQDMAWDFKDQLRMTRRQAVDDDDRAGLEHRGERTWYVYGATGQRARKVTELASGKLHEERIYLNGFEIYRRHGREPLERRTLHFMDGAKRLAMIETRTPDEDHGRDRLFRYQMSNHSGSVTLELDQNARILTYEEYTPFGSTSYQAVQARLESPKRYRYAGQERDDETGLNYHGARYYAPWLGRWTSSDPSGVKGGANTYAYVHCNPITKVDISGRWDIDWGDLAIGAGVALLTAGAIIVTAGAAAPFVVPAAATALGVTEATVVTGIAVVGTGAGVYSTTKTLHAVSTGVDPDTGAQLTDKQRSRMLGGGVVGGVLTVAGSSGIFGFGGGGSSGGSTAAAQEMLPAFQEAFAGAGNGGRQIAWALPSRAADSFTSTMAMVAVSSGGPGLTSGGGNGNGDNGDGNGAGDAPDQSAVDDTSPQSASSSSTAGPDPAPEDLVCRIPDEFYDEAISKIDEGDLEAGGAHLNDLTSYAQARGAKDEADVTGYQGAHTGPQSELRDLPNYNPSAALVRILDTSTHQDLDSYWKSYFQSRWVPPATSRSPRRSCSTW